MTNNEMLMAAIEFEEELFAYDLLYLISNGYLNPDDEYQELGSMWNKVDAAETRKMMENNLLGFNTCNIYCVKISVDDFEIFFARNIEEARGYMLSKYRFIPKIIEMDKSKYLKEFWFQDSNTYKSLMDIRKESNVFPRTALIV